MDLLTETLQKLDNITKKPELFLSIQDELGGEVRLLTKSLYDHVKKEEINNTKSDALPELIIEEFDEEQIWQQIELQNEALWNNLKNSVSWCVANKNKLKFPFEDKKVDVKLIARNPSEDEYNTEEVQKEECVNEEQEMIEKPKIRKNVRFEKTTFNEESQSKKYSKPTIVDDKFFKLREMEQFLEGEEKKEVLDEKKRKKSKKEEVDAEDSDSINLFESQSSEEVECEEEELKYEDFFDAPGQGYDMDQKESLSDGDEDDRSFPSEDDDSDREEQKKDLFGKDNKSDPKNQSEFELRQERLKRKINAIENTMLSEKPWQMKGEIDATSRPINSLLETVLDFDLTSRPAPVITEETTLRLEDIIKQRIKDKTWDDVERKEKPTEQPADFRKKIILDQEKSKKSLAEVYEQDYLKEKQKLLGIEEDQEEKKEHKEIKTAMQRLFSKLDALSNYHYTAKPTVPDVKIISNIPAITVEEVAPVAVSDAALLAPEEIKEKQRGELMSKDERTATDMKRERRKKKLNQRQKQKENQKKLLEKLNPGMGNKYSKEKAERTLDRLTKENSGIDKMDKIYDKSLKSSKSFFAQLQDDATTLGRAKKNKKLPASKFKL